MIRLENKKLQNKINREAAKISVLSSGKINTNEHLQVEKPYLLIKVE